MITVLNYGILAFAMLFVFLGLFYFMRGFTGRGRSHMYDVGRQEVRWHTAKRWVQGMLLFMVGLGLMGAWYLFDLAPPPAIPELQATASAPSEQSTETGGDSAESTQAETQSEATEPAPTPIPPTPTNVPIELDGATSTPPEDATPIPTVASTTVAPTAVVEPTEPLPPTETPIPTETPVPFDAFINSVGGLNMRDSAGGAVVALLEEGSGVFVLEGTEFDGVYNWRQVQTIEGEEGWVADEFLTFASESQ